MAPSLSIRSMLRTPPKNTIRLNMAMMDKAAAEQLQFQSEETSVSTSDEDHQHGGASHKNSIKRDASSPFKSPCSVRLASTSMEGGSSGSGSGKQRSSHHQPSPAAAALKSSVKRIPRRNKSVIVGERDLVSFINQDTNNSNNSKGKAAPEAAATAAASHRRHSMPFVPSANDNEEHMSDSFAEIKFNPVCDLDCTQSDHPPRKEQQHQQQQELITPRRKIAANMLRRANSGKNWLVPKSPRSKLSAFFSNTNITDSDVDDDDELVPKSPRSKLSTFFSSAYITDSDGANDDELVPKSPRSKLSTFFSNTNITDSDADDDDEKITKKVTPPRTAGAVIARVPPRPRPVPVRAPPAPSCYASPVKTPRQSISRSVSSRNVQMSVIPASAPTVSKPRVAVLNRGGQLNLRTSAGGVGGSEQKYDDIAPPPLKAAATWSANNDAQQHLPLPLHHFCRRTASTKDLLDKYDDILLEFEGSARGARSSNASTRSLEEKSTALCDGGTVVDKNMLLKNCLPGPPPLAQDEEKSVTGSDGDDDNNKDDDDDDDDGDDASIGLPEPAAVSSGARKPLALNRGGQVTNPQHAYFGRRTASTKELLEDYDKLLTDFNDSLNDNSLTASSSTALAQSLEDNPILGKTGDDVDDYSMMAPQARPRRRISCNANNNNNTKVAATSSSANARPRQSRQRRNSIGVCDTDAGKASQAQQSQKQELKLRHSEHTPTSAEKSQQKQRRNSTSFGCALRHSEHTPTSAEKSQQKQRRNSTSVGCAIAKEHIRSYNKILREFDDSLCAGSRSDDSTLWTLGTKSTKSTLSCTHSASTMRKPQTALSSLLQQQQQQPESNNNNDVKSKDNKSNSTKKKPMFAPPLAI